MLLYYIVGIIRRCVVNAIVNLNKDTKVYQHTSWDGAFQIHSHSKFISEYRDAEINSA